FGTLVSSNLTERMRIMYNGNVGIGPDTAPDYKLDVQGTFRADGAASFGSTIDFDASVGNKINLSGPGYGIGITGGELNTWLPAGANYSWRTVSRTGDEIMGLDTATGNLKLLTGDLLVDAGNVGIGTDAPDTKLDVSGNLRVLGPGGYNASGDQAVLYLGDQLAVEDGRAGIMAEHGFGLKFGVFNRSGAGSIGTESMDAMVIRQTTGNVGIGTPNPQRKLQV
ncbi:unnamed protein product, partial [marine sediment metagenome]